MKVIFASLYLLTVVSATAIGMVTSGISDGGSICNDEVFDRRLAMDAIESCRFEEAMKEKILLVYRYFEHFVVLVLLGLLMAVVLYATIGLAVFIVVTMVEKVHTREVTITLPLLHDVFAGFLTLLIGLELMKTIVMYLEEHVIHVEVVLSVAMIAIARHAIDVDYKEVPSLTMIGMGSIIIALAVGYFFFKKASLMNLPAGNVTPGAEGREGST